MNASMTTTDLYWKSITAASRGRRARRPEGFRRVPDRPMPVPYAFVGARSTVAVVVRVVVAEQKLPDLLTQFGDKLAQRRLRVRRVPRVDEALQLDKFR